MVNGNDTHPQPTIRFIKPAAGKAARRVVAPYGGKRCRYGYIVGAIHESPAPGDNDRQGGMNGTQRQFPP